MRPSLFKNHVLLFCFVFLSVIYTLSLVILTPTFETNDDVGMMMIVSGTGIAHYPDEHMRRGVTNVLIGKCLKKLYLIAADVPWYGIYLVGIHFFATLFLLYAYLNIGFSFSRLLFFLIYFVVVKLYFLVNLQFTVIAYMAGETGIFLFYLLFQKDFEKKYYFYMLYFASIILLLVSSLVRLHSFLMIVALAIPIMIVILYHNLKVKNYARLKTILLFFLIVGVFTVALDQYDKFSYMNYSGWKGYAKRLALQVRVIDFGHIQYDKTSKYIFDKVGWSENDFNMFKKWFFVDKHIYSTEKFAEINASIPPYRYDISAKVVWHKFKRIFGDKMVLYYVAVIFLFLFFITKKKDKTLLFLFSTLNILLLMSFLIIFKKIPLRVYLPLWAFLGTTSLFLIDEEVKFIFKCYLKKLSFQNFRIVYLLFVLLIVLPLIGPTIYSQNQIDLLKNRKLKQSISQLTPKEEQLFVVWGGMLPYESILPFEKMDYLEDFKILSIAGFNQTPVQDRIFDDYQIEDLHKSLFENPNLFLISSASRNKLLKRFIKEHYSTDVDFKVFFKNGFTVYKVIKSAAMHNRL
jgi:hypothetical protein